MSAIETTAGIFVAGALAIMAVIAIPTPRQKPEVPSEQPKPPAIEAELPANQVPTALDVVTMKQPDSDTERLNKLEQSVHQIKIEQQQLSDDVRTLVKELKAK